MRELMNLVINSITTLENNGSIKIAKVDENEFLFTGTNKDDNGNPYKFEISVRYSLADQGESQEEEIEKLKRKVELLMSEKENKEKPLLTEEKKKGE